MKYRVCKVSRDSRPGLYGWSSKTIGFDSLVDAEVELDKPMLRNVHTVRIDERTERGWKSIKTRKR